MPKAAIISFLKCVQLVIIGPALRIDLRILVLNEDPLHSPLTIDKATISNHKAWLLAIRPLLVPFLAARAHNLGQLILNIKHPVAPINDYELLKSTTLIIHAVTQPAKSVGNLAKPRRFLLPVNFFYIFDSIE